MQPGPIETFVAAFMIASLSGLAWLLRSGKPITAVNVFSAVLNTGLFGTVIAMIWYKNFAISEDGLWFLIGVAGLAGLGGISLLDFAITVVKAWIANQGKANGNGSEPRRKSDPPSSE